MVKPEKTKLASLYLDATRPKHQFTDLPNLPLPGERYLLRTKPCAMTVQGKTYLYVPGALPSTITRRKYD